MDLGSSYKEAKIRTFDMKGSRYKRKVLSINNSIESQSSSTLKDQDFLDIEKQIYIEGFNLVNKFK